MISLFTATHNRPDVINLWCKAINKTLLDNYHTTIGRTQIDMKLDCDCHNVIIPDLGFSTPIHMSQKFFSTTRTNVFLEEDMIPIRRWSVDDYPGDFILLEAYPNCLWASLIIHRKSVDYATSIPQTKHKDISSLPSWIPEHLKEQFIKAKSKTIGNHFIHLDKMSMSPAVSDELMAHKNKLRDMIHEYLDTLPDIVREDLGDVYSKPLGSLGPGSQLELILYNLGITSPEYCECHKKIALMNEWGCDECENQTDTICSWLKDECSSRKLVFVEKIARLLIKIAIKRSRKTTNVYNSL